MSPAPSRDELRRRVTAIVAEALDRDPSAVAPNDSLIDDLGAESIDFLDIQFRVESAFGLKFAADELWRGSVDALASSWLEDGRVTAAGLVELRRRQPGYRWERFAGGVLQSDLPRLLSVETIVLELERRLSPP
jgi:acyl carrier protein